MCPLKQQDPTAFPRGGSRGIVLFEGQVRRKSADQDDVVFARFFLPRLLDLLVELQTHT